MELIEEVVQIVLDDLNIDAQIYSGRVRRYAKQVKQSILNFTHLQDVPEGLLYVWADMTAAMLKAVLGDTDPIIGGVREQLVTSVQEGDTAISFGARETNVNINEANALSSIVHDATAQLVQYRVVKWS